MIWFWKFGHLRCYKICHFYISYVWIKTIEFAFCSHFQSNPYLLYYIYTRVYCTIVFFLYIPSNIRFYIDNIYIYIRIFHYTMISHSPHQILVSTAPPYVCCFFPWLLHVSTPTAVAHLRPGPGFYNHGSTFGYRSTWQAPAPPLPWAPPLANGATKWRDEARHLSCPRVMSTVCYWTWPIKIVDLPIKGGYCP